MTDYHLFFDADDTLWDEQGMLQHFERAIEAKLDELAGSASGFVRRFIALEDENVPHIGFGFPSYMFSFGEAIASNPAWHFHKPQLLETIRSLITRFTADGPDLFPGVRDTLATLTRRGYRLHLLTRGVEFEQRFKLSRTGLDSFFERVFVVPRKNRETYMTAVSEVNCDPERACMIGNSVRADINPAVEAGLHAIWIPASTSWTQDEAQMAGGDRVRSVERFHDLLRVLVGRGL